MTKKYLAYDKDDNCVLVEYNADNQLVYSQLTGPVVRIEPLSSVRGVYRSGEIVCNETGETFANAAAACKSHGVSRSLMSQHMRGNIKKIRGAYTFSYVTEE